MTFSRLTQIVIPAEKLIIALSNGSLGEGHLGMAFVAQGGVKQLIHLAWHKKLEVDTIDGGFDGCWIGVELDLPNSTSKQLVGITRAVAKKRLSNIPYGVNLSKSIGSFTNGKYKQPKGSDGLTCATFVVEMLAQCAVNLVFHDTWPNTAQSIAWANTVCTMLEHYGAETEHVQAVRNNVRNAARLRPFEVAGIATLPRDRWPVSYSEAQEPASMAQQALLDCCTDISGHIEASLGNAPH